jgi:hypothetical protein
MAYLSGHIKRNPATKASATKTVYSEDVPELAGKAWLIATVNFGPRFAATAEVEGWDDIYIPEA